MTWERFKNEIMLITYNSMNYISWLIFLPSTGILLYISINDSHTIIKEIFLFI